MTLDQIVALAENPKRQFILKMLRDEMASPIPQMIVIKAYRKWLASHRRAA